MSDPTAIPPVVTNTVSSDTTALPRSNAQVLELPRDFQTARPAETLNATVVRQNSDNSVVLRVDQSILLLDTDLNFEPGDRVTLRLEAISPPQRAFIQPINSIETLQSIATPIVIEQAAPLATSDLLRNDSVSVTPIPSANSSEITSPFIEVISENSLRLPNASPPVLLSDGRSDVDGFTTTINSFETFSNSAIQSQQTLPQSSAIDPDLIQNTQFNLPSQNAVVPFRFVAASTVSAEPIVSDTPTAPVLISAISVTDINQNNVNVLDLESLTNTLSNLQIGENRATFIGVTVQQHFPVFQTLSEEPSLFALQTTSPDLTIGSDITFDILQTTSVSPANALGNLLTSSLSLSSDSLWQSLNQVQATLSQNSPQVAQAFQASLPSPASTPQLASSVLFFLVAVRNGDAAGWLGESAIETLRRAGQGDLITRLGSEFAASRQESVSGDWRILSLPLAWQNEIHKVSVAYRKDDQDDGSDTDGSGQKTRFVMDLNLSAIGPLQLDALFVGNSEQLGRLDLIIRTEQSFSAAARQQMRTAYKSALNETQITGELSFQNTPEFWVHVQAANESSFETDI